MIPENLEGAKILLVDDHPANLRVLLEHLRETGFKILIARNGEGAIRQAAFAQPDLILLDVMMPPGIDGFETCRRLKQQEETKHIPVIFMTALSDTIDKVTGFDVGGVDYVTKPFDGVELLTRVKAHLSLQRYREELEYSNHKLRQVNEALLDAQKQLEIAARTDPLTHLSNRRDMIDKIEYEKVRLRRNNTPFTLAICDIDHFKVFNDTYGHDCGDMVLVSVANIMRSMIREQDQVARWGGEEFLLLFPETTLESGGVVAEKIRKTICRHDFVYHEQSLSISMTFGVSLFDDPSQAIDECINHADHALYYGKEHGRNCVVLAGTEFLVMGGKK